MVLNCLRKLFYHLEIDHILLINHESENDQIINYTTFGFLIYRSMRIIFGTVIKIMELKYETTFLFIKYYQNKLIFCHFHFKYGCNLISHFTMKRKIEHI